MHACVRLWVACVSSTDFLIESFYDPNNRFLWPEKCFYDPDDWFLWPVVRWDTLDSISGCLEFYERWVLCPWYRGSMPGYWWIANFKEWHFISKKWVLCWNLVGVYMQMSCVYVPNAQIRTYKNLKSYWNVYDLLLEFLWLPSMTNMTVLFL